MSKQLSKERLAKMVACSLKKKIDRNKSKLKSKIFYAKEKNK